MIPCFVIDSVVIPVGEKTPAPSPVVETVAEPLHVIAAREAAKQSTKKHQQGE
jgi:hypothetical protein